VRIEEYSSKSDLDEQEVGPTEWTRNSKLVGCPRVKSKTVVERYDFDSSTPTSVAKYLIYCYKINISAFRPTTCCHHLKSSRTRSGASDTTPPRTTPMNGCSSSRFNQPLNKDVSSSIIKKIDENPIHVNMTSGLVALIKKC
jgi:hypothetical protein